MRRWLGGRWLALIVAGTLAGCAWLEEEPAQATAAPGVAPTSDPVRLGCERRARVEHPGLSVGDVMLGNRYAQRRFVEDCLKEQGQPLQ